MQEILIFIAALALVAKGSTLATRYAGRLAQSYRLSSYAVGFIVVAVISILPETFISIKAAFSGVPSFGLGVLFGSNIADLTLVLALIIFLAGRGVRIESKILRHHVAYPLLLLVPLVLGFDGSFTRIEGAALVLLGCIFYYVSLREGGNEPAPAESVGPRWKNASMLLASMGILLVGAHFTVESAAAIAGMLGVNPVLIGLLVVGLGTTLPEFFFSLKSVRQRNDSLAVGDILGTVLADATIVVGILALANPFAFPKRIIYITGIFMLFASVILFHFMRSGRTITRREARMLLVFWVSFVLVEFVANSY